MKIKISRDELKNEIREQLAEAWEIECDHTDDFGGKEISNFPFILKRDGKNFGIFIRQKIACLDYDCVYSDGTTDWDEDEYLHEFLNGDEREWIELEEVENVSYIHHIPEQVIPAKKIRKWKWVKK